MCDQFAKLKIRLNIIFRREKKLFDLEKENQSLINQRRNQKNKILIQNCNELDIFELAN